MRAVAIDIGGTSIKAGLFIDNKLCKKKEIDTEALKGGEHIFNKVCELINSYNNFDCIGISSAGQINSDEGYVIFANENIPNYTGLQYKKRLEDLYKVAVSVENDVNAAALGEAHFGAATREQDFLCLTYGTGIGGAIVINHNIFHGLNYSAGEFGALITHGNDHKATWNYFEGAYEKYASTTALVNSALLLNAEYDNGKIILENINKQEVLDVFNNWIDEIVIGLVSLTHLFNPSCIILGGGIMANKLVIESINDKIYERLMPNYRKVVIKTAKLGNAAGLYGAVSPFIL